MAPLKLLVICGLMACVGCSGGNLPSGGVYATDAHAAVDAAVDVTVGVDTAPTDAASESSCPIGMSCGTAPWAATRVDGTCMFLLRCFAEGGFTQFGVVVDQSEIPMSPSDGWTYTDASKTVIELHGQVCSDLLSGVATTVAIVIRCPA